MDASRPAWKQVLETLAPPPLAAAWDNVGVILEGEREVRSILVCIDLTEAVEREADRLDVDLVVAYHPPIFEGLRALRSDTPRGRTLLALIRAGRHVYSPHTALDAVSGGVNDWLLEAFGPVTDVRPLEPSALDPATGFGRRATLVTPLTLAEALPAITSHLGLDGLRVAGRPEAAVRTVAVCPGAGGSLLRAVDRVDLLLTGEMRHHDVLAQAEAGTAVVLTNHTNSERGYLPRLAEQLIAALPEVTVHESVADADPLGLWLREP